MDQMKIIEQLKEDKEFLAKLGAVKDEAEAQAVFALRSWEKISWRQWQAAWALRWELQRCASWQD